MSGLQSYDAVLKALTMMKRLKKLEGTLLIHEGVLLHADTLFLESQEKAFVREVNALLSQYRNAGRPLTRAMLGFDGGNVMIFHSSPFVMCLIYGDVDDTGKVETAGDEFLKRWSDSLGLKSPEPVQQVDLPGEIKEEDKETAPVKVPILPASLPVSKESGNEVSEPELDEVIVEKEEEREASGGHGTDPGEPVTTAKSMTENHRADWLAYRESVENLLAKVLGRGQSRRFLERELSSMGIEGDGYLKQSQFRPFGQKLTLRVKDKAIRKQLDTELLTILEKFTH